MLNEWRAARYRAKKQKAQQERKERREKCRYFYRKTTSRTRSRGRRGSPGNCAAPRPIRTKALWDRDRYSSGGRGGVGRTQGGNWEPEMPEAETVQEIQTEQLSAPVECQEEIVETTPEELFFSEEKQPLFRAGDRVSPAEVLSGNGRRSYTTTGCP